MVNVISDPADAGFNSYVSIADMTAYCATLPLAEALPWDDLSDDVKARSLVSASRKLDRALRYIGRKVDANQPMQWPRKAISIDGHDPSVGFIPAEVKEATMEWARLIGVEMVSDLSELGKLGQSMSKVKLGSVELNFKSQPAADDSIPANVLRIIDRYGRIEATNGPTQGNIIRTTSGPRLDPNITTRNRTTRRF